MLDNFIQVCSKINAETPHLLTETSTTLFCYEYLGNYTFICWVFHPSIYKHTKVTTNTNMHQNSACLSIVIIQHSDSQST